MLRIVRYDVEWERVSAVGARETYTFICFRLLYHAFQVPSSPDLFVIFWSAAAETLRLSIGPSKLLAGWLEAGGVSGFAVANTTLEEIIEHEPFFVVLCRSVYGPFANEELVG
jgi:hypothetical protein